MKVGSLLVEKHARILLTKICAKPMEIIILELAGTSMIMTLMEGQQWSAHNVVVIKVQVNTAILAVKVEFSMVSGCTLSMGVREQFLDLDIELLTKRGTCFKYCQRGRVTRDMWG